MEVVGSFIVGMGVGLLVSGLAWWMSDRRGRDEFERRLAERIGRTPRV